MCVCVYVCMCVCIYIYIYISRHPDPDLGGPGQVHTTKYGLMRVYQILNVSQESLQTLAEFYLNVERHSQRPCKLLRIISSTLK